MRRYAETFFRYWFIILVPLVVLPSVMYLSVRHLPNSYQIISDVQVDQSPPGYTNQYVSAAQNEADAMNEFLQSSSNLFSVIAAANLQSGGNTNLTTLANSIAKNMVVTARGDHLVSVTYTDDNVARGTQVVRSFLSTVQTGQQTAANAQNQTNLYILNYQLREAQKQANQSYKTLHSYMDQHGNTNSDLTATTIADPQLASLYQQYQLDSGSVGAIQQQISKARAQTSLPPGVSQQSAFTIKDYPAAQVVSATKKKLTNIGIALAVALLLSLGFMVVKTLLDRSVRYAAEVPQLFELPVLAVVPYTGSSTRRRGRSRQAVGRPVPQGRLA